MWNKPKFSARIQDDVLIIIDNWCADQPTMSVTNGVEYVIADVLAEFGYIPPRCIYKDTEGHWDELHIAADGEFLGYGHLGEEIFEESIALSRLTKNYLTKADEFDAFLCE